MQWNDGILSGCHWFAFINKNPDELFDMSSQPEGTNVEVFLEYKKAKEEQGEDRY